jgi:hypothetical protein
MSLKSSEISLRKYQASIPGQDLPKSFVNLCMVNSILGPGCTLQKLGRREDEALRVARYSNWPIR